MPVGHHGAPYAPPEEGGWPGLRGEYSWRAPSWPHSMMFTLQYWGPLNKWNRAYCQLCDSVLCCWTITRCWASNNIHPCISGNRAVQQKWGGGSRSSGGQFQPGGGETYNKTRGRWDNRNIKPIFPSRDRGLNLPLVFMETTTSESEPSSQKFSSGLFQPCHALDPVINVIWFLCKFLCRILLFITCTQYYRLWSINSICVQI